MLITVTGASGFIGKALCRCLIGSGHHVNGCCRALKEVSSELWPKIDEWPNSSRCQVQWIPIGNLSPKTDWTHALTSCDCIIHLASKTPSWNNKKVSQCEFRTVNVQGTVHLAEQAVLLGVKRFIFISSIKVNGEKTLGTNQFSVKDCPAPKDVYSQTKLEAEQALLELSNKTGLEVIIIRPPLVYGPGVKGNLLNLLNQIEKGLPLPFGSINNKRSLVGLSNLIDLIQACIEYPQALNQIFMVSDDEDISTAVLLTKIIAAMDKSTRNLEIHPRLLKTVLCCLGLKKLKTRLLDNLTIDISQTKKTLNWKPIKTVDDEIESMVRWYYAR